MKTTQIMLKGRRGKKENLVKEKERERKERRFGVSQMQQR